MFLCKLSFLNLFLPIFPKSLYENSKKIHYPNAHYRKNRNFSNKLPSSHTHRVNRWASYRNRPIAAHDPSRRIRSATCQTPAHTFRDSATTNDAPSAGPARPHVSWTPKFLDSVCNKKRYFVTVFSAKYAKNGFFHRF